MSRYLFPDQSIIRLTLEDLDVLTEMQYAIYPEALAEKKEYLAELFKDEYLNIGVVMDKKLIGFLLSTREKTETGEDVFIDDLGILPEYQGKGLGTMLLDHLLKLAYGEKMKIGLLSRSTSLPMFAKQKKLMEAGYKVVRREFLKDAYFEEYGVHEDIHRIDLEPL